MFGYIKIKTIADALNILFKTLNEQKDTLTDSDLYKIEEQIRNLRDILSDIKHERCSN